MVSCVPGSPMDCAAMTPDRLARVYHPPARQIAAVAEDTNAAPRFAGQHRANLHALDTGLFHLVGQGFGDFVIGGYENVALVVHDVFENHAADDAVAETLDGLARLR
jgi:hypothetical protein